MKEAIPPRKDNSRMNHVGACSPIFAGAPSVRNKKIALERVKQEFITEANRRLKRRE
jgi:hypothetical protein